MSYPSQWPVPQPPVTNPYFGPPTPALPPPKSRKALIAVLAIAIVMILVLVMAASSYLQNAPGGGGIGGLNDRDSDGVSDASDNCPSTYNPLQADADFDGAGDACDSTPLLDRDGDGCPDSQDTFPDDPSECRDSDGDGVGDTDDFYDQGNGGIEVHVSDLTVYSDCDVFSPCDPYFEFTVDYNRDGAEDCTRTSSTYQDTNVLTNPPTAWVRCDIPESSTAIWICISVFDSDVTGWEWIDYRSGSGAASCFTVHSAFSDSWSGTGDTSDGYRANLGWAISPYRV